MADHAHSTGARRRARVSRASRSSIEMPRVWPPLGFNDADFNRRFVAALDRRLLWLRSELPFDTSGEMRKAIERCQRIRRRFTAPTLDLVPVRH